jgi:hypothetical protein
LPQLTFIAASAPQARPAATDIVRLDAGRSAVTHILFFSGVSRCA